MSSLLTAAEIESIKIKHCNMQDVHGNGTGWCAPCHAYWPCLPHLLAKTALSLLGDQPAPEQPTHHTNDCDLLIRHRACSCPFGEVDA